MLCFVQQSELHGPPAQISERCGVSGPRIAALEEAVPRLQVVAEEMGEMLVDLQSELWLSKAEQDAAHKRWGSLESRISQAEQNIEAFKSHEV